MKFKLVIITGLLILSQHLHASLAFKASKVERHATKIAELYGDNGAWYVNEYNVPKGKLQNLILSKRFPTKNAASLFWQKKYAHWGHNKNNLKPHEFVTSETDKAIWKAKEVWSSDWETKYSEWVKKEFDEKYFEKFNLATDCADAAVALRWIFARNNLLPMGIHLAGSKILFTHESMKSEWLSLPTHNDWHQDQRFLEILKYILGSTYTHSIASDSYPVAISKKGIKEGTFILILGKVSGHTQIVGETNYLDLNKAPVYLFSSTVPVEVRSLYKEILISMPRPVENGSGFKRFRWLESKLGKWQLKPIIDHPLYSLKQFDSSFSSEDKFVENLYKELNVTLNPKAIITALIKDLKTSIDLRINAVEKGYTFCKISDCSKHSKGWEDWSTPSRDKRILGKITTINKLLLDFSRGGNDDLKDDWENAKKLYNWDILSKKRSLKEIVKGFQANVFSFDPNLSIAHRWGSTPLAISENILTIAKQLIAERKIKIGGNTSTAKCTTYCHYTSDNFKKNETYLIDQKIASLTLGWKSFCSFNKKKDCLLLEKRLSQSKVKIPTQSNEINLIEFFNLTPLFNSDPNTTYEWRWGKRNFKFQRVRLVPGLRNFSTNKSGLAIISKNEIWEIKSNKKLFAPTDDEVKFHPQDDDLIYSVTTKDNFSKNFNVFNYSTWSWFSINFKSSLKHENIYWLDHQYFILDSKLNKDSLEIYKYDSRSVTLVKKIITTNSITHNNINSGSKLHFLAYEDNSGSNILYIDNNLVKEIKIQSKIDLTKISNHLKFSDNLYLIATKNQIIGINALTNLQKIIKMPKNFSVENVVSDLNLISWQYIDVNKKLVALVQQFDDNFDLLRESKYPNYKITYSGYNNGNAYYFASLINGVNVVPIVFRVNDKKIETYSLASSTSFEMVYNEHILSTTVPSFITTYTNFDSDFSYITPDQLFLRFCHRACRLNKENLLIVGNMEAPVKMAFTTKSLANKFPIPILTSVDNHWTTRRLEDDFLYTNGAEIDHVNSGRLSDKKSIIYKYHTDVFVFLSNLE